MAISRSLLLLGVLSSSAAAFAADSKVAGKWTISGDVQGYPISDVCVLTGTDDKLTGTCTMDGKDRATTGSFDGTAITLTHPGEYNGQALTLTYKGKLKDDGTVSGDIDVQPLDYQGTFTATRDAAK